jgi:hypothetical protein
MRESIEENSTDSALALPKDGGESKSARCVLGKFMKFRSLAFALAAMASCDAFLYAPLYADDSKSKTVDSKPVDSGAKSITKSVWSYPSYSEARQTVVAALEEMKLPPAAIQNALRAWPASEIGPAPSQWLDALAETFHSASPALGELVDRARMTRKTLSIPEYSSLESEPLPAFVKNHVRLMALARSAWLLRRSSGNDGGARTQLAHRSRDAIISYRRGPPSVAP